VTVEISVRRKGTTSDVLVLLSEAEAEGVASALRARLEREPGHQGPGYHLHIEDGNGSEFTLGVLDPD
jgi:hypothetical protein